MKHKTLNTLVIIIFVSNIFSYDISNSYTSTKSYAYDHNNNSYIHFNDSLFHIITNLSNDKFLFELIKSPSISNIYNNLDVTKELSKQQESYFYEFNNIFNSQ